ANELFPLLAISEEAPVRPLLPRAHMDLVDGPGSGDPVRSSSLLHPIGISPFEREIPHDRSALGRLLAEEGERVGLVDFVTLAGRETRVDSILVTRPLAHARDETFPDPRSLQKLQRGSGRA